MNGTVRTRLIQHLVALVENEMLQVSEAKMPVAHKRVDTTWRADNDVRVGVLVAEQLDVLLHWSSAVEDTDLDIGQELGEAVVLVPNLVRQFTGMAHDQDSGDARLWLVVHLLERSKNENSRLAETGLGLAKHIVSKNSLGDGNLLDCSAQCMSEKGLVNGRSKASKAKRPSILRDRDRRSIICASEVKPEPPS